MSDTNSKSVSARGAFVIGLFLGTGLMLLYSTFQTSRLSSEVNKLRSELELTNHSLIQAHGDIASLKAQKMAEKPK